MSYGYSVRVIDSNKEANPELIGVELGRLCIKHDLPVNSVSETLGVSRQTVYNWFCGTNSPQEEMIKPVKLLVQRLARRK